jgi:ferredoxin-type protein NapG
MGTAVIDRKRCYTYLGSVLCKTCFEKCPLKARAIELDLGLYPVITKECVGCGVCEHVCPAQCIDTYAVGEELPPAEEDREQSAAGAGPHARPGKPVASRPDQSERPERPGILGLLAKVLAS